MLLQVLSLYGLLSQVTGTYGLPSQNGTLCRSMPGDMGWPAPATWNQLNTTVGGRLLAAVPVADVCHGATYSETACSALKQDWDLAGLITAQPADIMSPWFQNQSCVPFTNVSTPCELGNYASYLINVSSIADIQAGLSFTSQNNVRLVIKNTGHDYLGKSTGAGALSLWTHNMDSLEIISAYQSPNYSGPALKAGSGVQGHSAVEFAAQYGYRVVAGGCPDVGMVGGYAQGGGHSFLTSHYGLAAENVLEWEVVTATGEHLVATPSNNTDLYWALSGGGGGTYGVVVSMTARIFPDGIIASGGYLSFNTTTQGSVDAYWDSVGHFLVQLQPLVDEHGLTAAFEITNDTLTLFSLIAPGFTHTNLTTMMGPLLSAIGFEGASAAQIHTRDYPSYFAMYNTTLAPLIAAALVSPVTAGRFVSRENVAGKNWTAVLDAFRTTTLGGAFYITVDAMNVQSQVRQNPPIAPNAVLPAWNNVFLNLIVSAAWEWDQPWNETVGLQEQMTSVILPALEAATPNAHAYLNEGNWQQANWQHVFYGSNYQRLRQIKLRYDPDHLLYARTAVGSEAWAMQGGHLCSTS